MGHFTSELTEFSQRIDLMSSSKFWGAKFWVTKHSMGESEMLITNGNL
jgi:hypothetical protein